MSDRLSFSRRQFVRLAALAGSLSLAAGFPGKVAAAAAAPSVAAASPAAKPFTNGIDPPTYVGGDGSYARYAKDGLRLGLIEAFPVNYTDPTTGQRTGWNTDLVLTALDRAGLTKYEFVQGPWESMVPGLQIYILAFNGRAVGQASALAISLVVLVLLFVLPLQRLSRGSDE